MIISTTALKFNRAKTKKSSILLETNICDIRTEHHDLNLLVFRNFFKHLIRRMESLLISLMSTQRSDIVQISLTKSSVDFCSEISLPLSQQIVFEFDTVLPATRDIRIQIDIFRDSFSILISYFIAKRSKMYF